MPIELIFTPKSRSASRAARVYGTTAASTARSRASEPLMRPGSTPICSRSGRHSDLQTGQR